VRGGTPLAIPHANTLSDGVAKQLAAAGAFSYNGTVGDFRAPWMGNWYFVRNHPLYEGLPADQVMGIHYQAKGRQSNGLLVDGPNVEIVAAYSRDHDRNIGAGTFTAKLGSTKILFHRIPDFTAPLQKRFLANAIHWLTS
jgi:beta-galactosidase